MKISISTTRFGTTSHQLTSFASYTLWWSPSSFAKLEFSLQRARKPLSSGQKWYPQVDYLQRHSVSSHSWFQIFILGTGSAFSEVRKNSGLFSLSKRRLRWSFSFLSSLGGYARISSLCFYFLFVFTLSRISLYLKTTAPAFQIQRWVFFVGCFFDSF